MATLRDFTEIAGWLRSIPDSMERGANKGVVAITQEATKLAKQMTKVQFTGRRGRTKSGNLMNAIVPRFDVPKAAKGRPLVQGYVVVRAQKGNKGTQPYGRVHEFGKPSATDSEPIKPRKAKFLWLKNYEGDARRFKDMTPSDFISAMRSDPASFHLIYPDKKKNKQKIPIAWWFGTLERAKDRRGATRQGRRARFGTALKRAVKKAFGIRSQRSAARRKRDTGPKWVPLFFLRKKVRMPERPFVRPAIQAAVGPNGARFWGIVRRFMREEG